MAKPQKLKPCPFCGRIPHGVSITMDNKCFIVCPNLNCVVYCKTEEYPFIKLAVKAWNRRKK